MNDLYLSLINNTFYNNHHFPKWNGSESAVPSEIAQLYKDKKGSIFNFFSSDTEKLFNDNLKKQPSTWYYRNNPVTYTLNSLGFRTKEFDEIDWKESIVMFGCSNVLGVGVTDEHTIPYFLEKMIGRSVVNMGISGSSIQTTLRNSLALKDSNYPNPKAVISLWTELNRYECYFKDTIGFYGSQNVPFGPLSENSYHTIHQNLMNIKIFRNLWKENVVYEGVLRCFAHQQPLINHLDKNYICHLIPRESPKEKIWKPFLARDMMHYGPKTNFIIATQICEKLKSDLL